PEALLKRPFSPRPTSAPRSPAVRVMPPHGGGSEAWTAPCAGKASGTTHSTQAAHHVGQAAALHLLHHLLHLLVLLEQPVQVLDVRPRALGDAAFARAAENVRVQPLLHRHG